MHNGLNSNGGKGSLKKPGQQRRQGVTGKAWGFFSLWFVLVVVLSLSLLCFSCRAPAGCFWWGCGGRVRGGFLSYYTYRPGGGGLRVLPRCKRFGAFGGLDDTPASCRAGGVGDGPAPPWVMCPPGSRRPGEAEGGPAPPIVVYPKAVPVGVKVCSASWPSRLQGRTPPHGTSNNIFSLP